MNSPNPWSEEDLLDVNVREVMSFEPDEDTVDQIRSMMDTPGWKLLETKLFPKWQYILLLECSRSSADPVFSRGRYDGFKFAQRLVNQIVRAKHERKQGSRRENIFTQKSARAAGGGY